MTRKDYELLANALASCAPQGAHSANAQFVNTCLAIADALTAYPNFDKQKFLQACFNMERPNANP